MGFNFSPKNVGHADVEAVAASTELAPRRLTAGRSAAGMKISCVSTDLPSHVYPMELLCSSHEMIIDSGRSSFTKHDAIRIRLAGGVDNSKLGRIS